MEQRLKNAAQEGNIDALYALFRENPYILEDIDKIPFADTPLHIAASAGCTHFAVEMISLKPLFGRKLNPDGLSPLHLALQNGHTEIVTRLINIDSKLIRVQGKERITPLHHVAEKNEFDLLAEFLCACPASIKDLTVRGETAVHIATRNGSFDALEVLLGWLDKFDNQGLHWKVLNWKNEDGDTALHIAASTNQPQLVKLLIKNEVDISARNLEGKTAVDLSERYEEVRNMLIKKKKKEEEEEVGNILVRAIAGVLSKASSSPSKSTSLAKFVSSVELHEKLPWLVPTLGKGLSSDMPNMVMVVAVLIATVTYEIVFQPPGGFRQEKDNNNPAINIPFLNSSAILNSTTANNTTMDHYIFAIINNTAAINSSSAIDDLAGTVVLSALQFNILNVLNSFAFAASIGVILLALPPTFHSLLLASSLVFLAGNYLYAILFISPYLYSLLISLGAFLFVTYLVSGRIWAIQKENRIFRIFGRVPLCRFNPSHYIEMRHQLFD